MPSQDRLPLYRTVLGTILAVALVLGIYGFYRAHWSTLKRLREVDPNRVYRSGQMTAQGFRHAIETYGIRCVVNLQNEDEKDRDLFQSWYDGRRISEEEFCKEIGVKYIQLAPDLVPRMAPPGTRPKVIEHMLQVYDNPEHYPMLIHCKAGLHRTGILAAIYRMEYQGWTPDQAFRELSLHGFGKECHEANDYVREYVLEYRPGVRDRSSSLAAKDQAQGRMSGTSPSDRSADPTSEALPCSP